MKRILASLLFAPVVALAQTLTYVATTGSDSNNCLSQANACLTPSKGLEAAGSYGILYISAGSYYWVNLNLSHSKFVTVIGDCNNTSAVALFTSGSGAVATVQDHATLTLQCLKLGTVSNGSVGIYARQFSIADWKDVVFGHFPLGVHVALSEMSKGNCIGNIGITGDAQAHLLVSGGSYGSLSCAMAFSGSPTIAYFISAGGLSQVLANASTFSGSATITSAYSINTSLLTKGSVTIPGGAGTNSNGWVQ